jgi:hypothetical protein
MSTSSAPCTKRTSPGTRSPSSRTTTSPGTSPATSSELGRPSRKADRLLRQIARQRLDGALGLKLLSERERGVQEDHKQHRDRDHAVADRE